jgi:NAD(P)-dependent dehydrogenase (short-subunit alcohol dehydrogenase family)
MSATQRDPFSLEGQVGLITGGGTGLGLGTARAFVAKGARVVIVGRREEVLQKAVEELGPQADYRVHDVADFSSSEGLIQSIEAQHGALTALVNNAGILLKKPTEDMTEDEMLEILNIHLVGAFSLSKYAARRMMEMGGGSIVFISSMAGLFGIPYVAAYSAAKTAHLGLVRTMTTEWAARGVRINAIAPGWIETDLNREVLKADHERMSRIMARTPMKCMGEAADIGWTAAFLASPAAKFITGTCIPVDGGAAIGF